MPDQGPTVGQYLKRQRENSKVSLEAIARGTRIKQAFLQALEEDAFHLLPAETYVRGFLQCYAKFLRLDPAEVLSLYHRQVDPDKDQARKKSNGSSPLKSAKGHLFDFLTTMAGGAPAYSVGKPVLRSKD